MPQPQRSRRAPLRVEPLEARENPAVMTVVLSENFDQTAPGKMPSDWVQWSNLGATSFAATNARAYSGPNALATSGASNLTARAWITATQPANTGVSATVFTDSLEPLQLFTRGQNPSGSTPSYYAVSITRGLTVELVKVVNGTTTTLGTARTTSYLSGAWVKATLTTQGDQLGIEIQRLDTRQFLNASGGWQSAQVQVIQKVDGALAAGGFVGVNRPARYAGTVVMDDFAVLGTRIFETFDATAVGALPPGWTQYTFDGSTGFGAATGKALSAPNGLAVTGTTATTSRTWLADPQPADVKVSAAVYLDSLIPGQVFARGTNLNTSTPSFYALSVTRGVQLQLHEVVNGARTVIGQVTTTSYLSNVWVKVTLEAEGTTLRASVQRTDTGQWLTASGGWSGAQSAALTVTDTTITGGGQVGLNRAASYSGTSYYDDVVVAGPADDSSPPGVTITSPLSGAVLSGTTTVQATATDPSGVNRVEFWLNNSLKATDTTSPYSWAFDTRTVADGTYTLTVRAYDNAGNFASVSRTVSVSNATPPGSGNELPNVPRHYPHIRFAFLAYYGWSMGSTETNLLRTSADIVIPNPAYLGQINSVAPDTPQLIYSNVSNLYGNLLTDWLAYADQRGMSRELAFYHAATATPWTGDSPSSQPVTWFWNVTRGGASATTGLVNLTSAARTPDPGDVTFGNAGEAVSIGYTDKFREINVVVSRPSANGWAAQMEYVSAVDANGRPTAWKALPLLEAGTRSFTQSGRIVFDPPADWKAASLNGSPRLFYVRARTVTGGTVPIVSSMLGRDYVNARGTTSGTIPAFDSAADADRDGYLNDAEYSRRAAGKDARFLYESRLFYPFYGQMRFVTNPQSAGVDDWAADFAFRVLQANPLADGLFLDNSHGKFPLTGYALTESTTSYATDYATMLGVIGARIAPKWLMPNTSGGGNSSDAVVAATPSSIEENAIRPLAHNWTQFEFMSDLVNRRQSLSSPSPYLVIDSYLVGGSPTDPRSQIATLAYYYLIGNPQSTFLMYNGGSDPSGPWTEHWVPAAAYNVGQPRGTWGVYATGTDPANGALTYNVYSRSYDNALVLYKPLSYASNVTGTTADNTGTWHTLPGTYRILRADGTLGSTVTQVFLRNGEGAVLVKV